MGMDISSVITELDSGVIYKDYNGKVIDNVTDFCKFLAENDINHIRVRVWNNPYDSNGNGYGGGNNDVATAKKIADACRSAGIKMLVDFIAQISGLIRVNRWCLRHGRAIQLMRRLQL